MNREEKIEYINNLIDDSKADMLAKVDSLPEHWRGYELTWWISCRFAGLEITSRARDRASHGISEHSARKTARYKRFEKDVLSLDLDI